MLGPLEQYMTPTHDAALLYSSRAGSDLGRTLDRFEELCQLVISMSERPLLSVSEARNYSKLIRLSQLLLSALSLRHVS